MCAESIAVGAAEFRNQAGAGGGRLQHSCVVVRVVALEKRRLAVAAVCDREETARIRLRQRIIRIGTNYVA